jgi:hypothetical protein
MTYYTGVERLFLQGTPCAKGYKNRLQKGISGYKMRLYEDTAKTA